MKNDSKKLPKYSFADMKIAAMSDDAVVRKKEFCDYFERFGEFPSFLFDTDAGVDQRLLDTISDLKSDPLVSDDIKRGIARLVERLPMSGD